MNTWTPIPDNDGDEPSRWIVQPPQTGDTIPPGELEAVLNAEEYARQARASQSAAVTQAEAAALAAQTATDAAASIDPANFVPVARLINGKPLSANVVLDKGDVGLANVDNTADIDKPISTAAQNALVGKVPVTRTVNGKSLNADIALAQGDVGLANVDNTSDLNKPISTAASTALAAKVGTTGNWVMSGTLTNTSGTMSIQANNANRLLWFRHSDGTPRGLFYHDSPASVMSTRVYNPADTTQYKEMRLGWAGTATWNGFSLWHSGNFDPTTKLDKSSATGLAFTAANAGITLSAGGRLYDTAAGAAAGVTILLAASDNFQIWKEDSSANLLAVTDATFTYKGQTVWRADNFDPASKSDSSFTQNGVGAVARPLHDKVKEIEISVLDYWEAIDLDHTNAIQRACNRANSMTGYAGEIIPAWYYPVVVFPAQDYTISAQISPARAMRGKGQARIVAATDTFTMFAANVFTRLDIEDLTFVGGLTQWGINNPNIDNGIFNFTRCHFYYSADYAVMSSGDYSSMYNFRDCNWRYCNGFVSSDADVVNIWGGWGMPHYANFTQDRACFNMARAIDYPQMLQVFGFTGVPVLGESVAYVATAGQTTFATHPDFPITTAQDIAVVRSGAYMTYAAAPVGTGQFSVAGVGTKNGSITFGAGLAAGENVSVSIYYYRARWCSVRGAFRSYGSRWGGENAGIPVVWHHSVPEAVTPFRGGEIVMVGNWVEPGHASQSWAGAINLRNDNHATKEFAGVPVIVHWAGNRGPYGVPIIRNESVGTGGVDESGSPPAWLADWYADVAISGGTGEDETTFFAWNIDTSGWRPRNPVTGTDIEPVPASMKRLMRGTNQSVTAKAYRSSTLPMPGGATTKLQCNIVSFDTAGLWDAVNFGYRIKKAGVYRFAMQYYGSAPGAIGHSCQLLFQKNNVTEVFGPASITTGTTANDIVRLNFSADILCAPGDLISAAAARSVGSDTLTASAGTANWFTVHGPL